MVIVSIIVVTVCGAFQCAAEIRNAFIPFDRTVRLAASTMKVRALDAEVDASAALLEDAVHVVAIGEAKRPGLVRLTSRQRQERSGRVLGRSQSGAGFALASSGTQMADRRRRLTLAAQLGR